MSFSEQIVLFGVEGAQMLGIVASPDQESDLGVLVVVGGPQYRVGSHRQFLLLSRYLAKEGFCCMRFDYRGMGDSDGAPRGFESVSEDIGAAIDAFLRAKPSVKRIILWGLCDAASASLLYLDSFKDRRVAGLVLLNPWVRSESSLAQTQIKHYYGQRLLQREFWTKLFAGRLNLTRSLGQLFDAIRRAAMGKRLKENCNSVRPFQDRMAAGLDHFNGPVLLMLSGKDYTAKEFLEFSAGDPLWRKLLSSDRIHRLDVGDADHTFSSRVQRSIVEQNVLNWLREF